MVGILIHIVGFLLNVLYLFFIFLGFDPFWLKYFEFFVFLQVWIILGFGLGFGLFFGSNQWSLVWFMIEPKISGQLLGQMAKVLFGW